MTTESEAKTYLERLAQAGFIGPAQRAAIHEGFHGEEAQFFFDQMGALFAAIQAMPQTYDQDGLGKNAVAHLHYFIGGCDWHITEKDMLMDQRQAFGRADLGYGGELGYISLMEITRAGAELDLYWTPKTLAELEPATA